jgi:hypothetical protein
LTLSAKISSQCGVHVRSNIMHVATHWNDYSKEGLDHLIPKAIGHVAVRHFPSFFSFPVSHDLLFV